jgi:hypothetical protein
LRFTSLGPVVKSPFEFAKCQSATICTVCRRRRSTDEHQCAVRSLQPWFGWRGKPGAEDFVAVNRCHVPRTGPVACRRIGARCWHASIADAGFMSRRPSLLLYPRGQRPSFLSQLSPSAAKKCWRSRIPAPIPITVAARLGVAGSRTAFAMRAIMPYLASMCCLRGELGPTHHPISFKA